MKMVFAILIILIGVYLLFSESNFSWFGWSNDSRSENISGVKRVDVDVSGINTKIVPDDRSDLKVDLRGKGDLKLERTGDEIQVKYRKGWFNSNWFSFGKTKLTIYIPRDYEEELILDHGSGNLEFSGTSENNPIKLKVLMIDMSSGNLKLNNIHAEKFTHDGSSGNVDINYLQTDSGEFEISSGNIKVRHYVGRLEAKLSSGNFNMQLDELIDDVNVELSSGSANLRLPEDGDFNLNGKTNSGHITCDFPLKNKTVSNKKVEGSYGSGEHLIELSVASGNIKVH